MGAPAPDVDRLRAVLELAKAFRLELTVVRVGDVELHLRTNPSPHDAEPAGAHLSKQDREARAAAEYEATMYGASEGVDLLGAS